ncbi:hypothetical protein PIB30_004556 [Stylosanthes scabra]|uniref:Uncharacterized protein n=1 Tax=Stylosanthes scabra TaxID=79078 RepID=A0ABU6Y3X4_9FABA|nr:hypothetical protein [Stylosanthes scabra]
MLHHDRKQCCDMLKIGYYICSEPSVLYFLLNTHLHPIGFDPGETFLYLDGILLCNVLKIGRTGRFNRSDREPVTYPARSKLRNRKLSNRPRTAEPDENRPVGLDRDPASFGKTS